MVSSLSFVYHMNYKNKEVFRTPLPPPAAHTPGICNFLVSWWWWSQNYEGFPIPELLIDLRYPFGGYILFRAIVIYVLREG